ncbi:MAG: acyltransferase [Crocinitomicaceae bacterium]|nr:acyltransferase [Crocinitomicaceae bacterium]MBK8924515.1 acyltransferase [Crocinitomicaceae bacterium]
MSSVAGRDLGHIETVRALAALSVAVFHFSHYTNGTNFLINSDDARNITIHGAQGVELFYIVSGFIIPFALHRAGYAITDYFRYLGKRLSRLYPPYLITILAIISMNFILCKFIWHIDFDIHFKQVIVNVFFLADLFPEWGWINPVFATLEVEIQFYLLIGILFPFMMKNNGFYLLISAALLLLGMLTRDTDTALVNMPYFLTGFNVFYLMQNGNKWISGLIQLSILFCLYRYFQWPDLFVSILGFVLILWLPRKLTLFKTTGKISYSYYLIHGLLGGWFLYFTSSLPSWSNYPWLYFLLALAISWVGAFILYQLIEKPCLRWSASIQYKRNETKK